MNNKREIEPIKNMSSKLGPLEIFFRETNKVSKLFQKRRPPKKPSVRVGSRPSPARGLVNLARAELAFGGTPASKSKGIAVEFTTEVLREFQNIVSKVQAFEQLGKLASRGKIPNSGSSQLMLTGVTSSPFGFILEEPAKQLPLVPTPLRTFVEHVTEIIKKTASADSREFDELIPSLDERVLISLRNFFSTLDRYGATLQLTGGAKNIMLTENAVKRGRIRTESTVIDKKVIDVEGTIVGFLPKHRKFELKTQKNNILYGTASQNAAEQYSDLVFRGKTIINKTWRIKIDTRIIKPINRPKRYLYKLVEFVQPVEPT